AVEDAHVGRAALALADDDVGPAVAVDVAGRHVDAVGEVAKGGEVLQQRAVRAAESEHVGAAAHAGTGDDVGPAVAVDVAAAHADAAREGGIVREEVVQGAAILAAEDIHVRAAAGVGADDNVGE